MGWKGAEGGVEVAEQDLEGLLRMPRLSSATGGCREIAALEIGATSHMGRQS